MQYFSRRAIEHGSASCYSVMDEVVSQQVASSDCILDGEIIVWNKTR